jgi:hypothetical protein
MTDRDLLEIFDAALPRLETYTPGSVPLAGNREHTEHQGRTANRRAEMGVFGLLTGAMGVLTWLVWTPWMPIWLLGIFAGLTGVGGAATAKRFLQLAFGQRLEQALPPGTDTKTAELEDGTWSLIRYWNYDVFIWNGRVDALRTEVSNWQLLRTVPEARDIDWSEKCSMTQAEGLIAAIQGLAADRSALVARRREIEHRLRSLDDQLRRLQAEETPTLALPPPDSEDPTDEG